MKPESANNSHSARNLSGGSASAPGRNSQARALILLCLGLAAIVLGVYVQVGNHQFLGFDDDVYITSNQHVADGITGENIIWALTSIEAANWHPLTWLSHMADVQLYGMHPGGHHLTNVLIHLVSSLVLMILLFRSTGSLWQSALVAYLFALHPLHVESVAWVAERKDVLSGLFWMLTLLAYSEYQKRRKTYLYLLSLLCFALGLMSKPMLVTLPLIMLLWDFWPLGRYRQVDDPEWGGRLQGRALQLVREKIPFFACSLLSAAITIYAQHKGGATRSLEAIPLVLRVENALVAYVTYLVKTLWPHDLAVLYPAASSVPPGEVVGSLVFLLLASAAAIRLGRRYPFCAAGWFWFLVTLVPVIGLIQVGNQAMADRYSYLPSIGLFVVAAWGVPALTRSLPCRQVILTLCTAAAVIACAALTWQQLGYWRDSISLFRHTLQVTAENYVITNNLGVALSARGDREEGIRLYRESLRINPGYLEAHNNLGVALAQKGELDAALTESQAALQINPNDPVTHYNLGRFLAQKGDLAAAAGQFRLVLRMNPNNADAHINLGAALAGSGELDGAIEQYREALRLGRDNKDAHFNLAVALANKGERDAAAREFQEVLRISPDDGEARSDLARILAQRR